MVRNSTSKCLPCSHDKHKIIAWRSFAKFGKSTKIIVSLSHPKQLLVYDINFSEKWDFERKNYYYIILFLSFFFPHFLDLLSIPSRSFYCGPHPRLPLADGGSDFHQPKAACRGYQNRQVSKQRRYLSSSGWWWIRLLSAWSSIW